MKKERWCSKRSRGRACSSSHEWPWWLRCPRFAPSPCRKRREPKRSLTSLRRTPSCWRLSSRRWRLTTSWSSWRTRSTAPWPTTWPTSSRPTSWRRMANTPSSGRRSWSGDATSTEQTLSPTADVPNWNHNNQMKKEGKSILNENDRGETVFVGRIYFVTQETTFQAFLFNRH